MPLEVPLREACEWERPPHYPPPHPTCLHLGSFTHTFPTGMEPHRPARTANGRRGRLYAAYMAVNLRRLIFTLIWIITLVSSSRTRTYPPNEGECGGNRRRAHSGRQLAHAWKHHCVRPVNVSGCSAYRANQ